MIASMLMPAAAAIGAVLTERLLVRRVPPAVTAPAVAAMGVALVAAVTAALSMLVVALAAHSSLWRWCPPPPAHDHVPTWAGAGAAGLLVVGVTRGLLVVLHHHRARTSAPAPGTGLVVVDTPEPFAYAQSGRPGRIVVTTGLLACLDESEGHALLAHEQAHLDHDHHRYLMVADLFTAATPVLTPLSHWLRYTLERWADEDAADAVGDRQVVARAIGRAALARTDFAGSTNLGLSAFGTTARVHALQSEPDRRGLGALILGGLVLVAVVAASTGMQIHHLVTFTLQLC